MADTKTDEKVIAHNRSDKPENVVKHEADVFQECEKIEEELPKFMRNFFVYLRGNVLPMTRLNYLRDIKSFCEYLCRETVITDGAEPHEITLKEFAKIKAKDINYYMDYCRHYSITKDGVTNIYENNNKTLARKKSSLSVLFKQLYRDELLEKNITDGFDPIRVQKAGEREIKALQDDEVMVMLDAVSNGNGLTDKERTFWEKTKKRDKAILILFLTYGLRLSELWQLNISSFNFERGEFKIYRKRGKESLMPLNNSVTTVVLDYINNERLSPEKIQEGDEDALFLSLRGSRMTERQLREMVKKYTAIGMKTSRGGGYSPHKLRATAATSLIGRGNSIYDVAALLDHEQVTTTQLYARQKQGIKRDLVRGMEWEEERLEGSEAQNDISFIHDIRDVEDNEDE